MFYMARKLGHYQTYGLVNSLHYYAYLKVICHYSLASGHTARTFRCVQLGSETHDNGLPYFFVISSHLDDEKW